MQSRREPSSTRGLAWSSAAVFAVWVLAGCRDLNPAFDQGGLARGGQGATGSGLSEGETTETFEQETSTGPSDSGTSTSSVETVSESATRTLGKTVSTSASSIASDTTGTLSSGTSQSSAGIKLPYCLQSASACFLMNVEKGVIPDSLGSETVLWAPSLGSNTYPTRQAHHLRQSLVFSKPAFSRTSKPIKLSGSMGVGLDAWVGGVNCVGTGICFVAGLTDGVQLGYEKSKGFSCSVIYEGVHYRTSVAMVDTTVPVRLGCGLDLHRLVLYVGALERGTRKINWTPPESAQLTVGGYVTDRNKKLVNYLRAEVYGARVWNSVQAFESALSGGGP